MSLFERIHSAAAAFVLAAVVWAAPLPAAAQPLAASAPWALPDSTPESVAPTAASAPPMPPAVVQETVENPYGLGALWRQGDWISRGTLILLLLMSIGSWYILVTKLYESLKVRQEAKSARLAFFSASTLHEAVQKLEPGSAFRFIADAGLHAGEHHAGPLTENVDRNTWVSINVQRSLDDVQSRLQDGLSFLATVGSTAPFVGLFGTVWAIYHALTAIGIAGQASIDKVAGPVGEALIMTAIGLAVAVPAVLGYNWLVRRNKLTMESVRGFGADLHGVLMGAPIGAER